MIDVHSMLTADHARVERLFRELENAADGADQPTVASAYGAFERGVLAHFEAEERLLFPALEGAHAEEVARARREHDAIRALIAELGVRADLHLLRKSVADQLIARLREHGAWEDRTLYPWFAATAGAETRRSVRAMLERGG